MILKAGATWRLVAAAVCACLVGLLAAAAAPAYTFGEPSVRAAGPEFVAFNWSAQSCNENDIPDQPARAFRNAGGQVVLIDSHFTVRPKIGPTLASVAPRCDVLMGSTNSSDPASFNNREWLASTYTLDGTTVYGVIHNEYQGWTPRGYCLSSSEPWEERHKCWYNSITLTRSTDGGATFSHAPAPTHRLAGAPYQYADGNGPYGFYQPSNIVRAADGFYYMLVHVEDYGLQPLGSCLLRADDLADPRSWRGWNGAGFNTVFFNPYTEAAHPSTGVCQPVSFRHIGTLSQSLTWSTYLKKWVLVGHADNADGVSGPGFYHYTSDDLINWGPAKLLMRGELPWTHTCADGPEQIRDPSLLDNDSSSRSFETIGQRPYLFFTRFNMSFGSSSSECWTSLDRDLIRIRVEFSNRVPGGPTAVLDASTVSPATGEEVRFDASGSADADGTVRAYKWDLDGDGAFERDTGTNAVTRRAYGSQGKVTVTLRVCDNQGKATDETVVLDVSGPAADVPPAPGDAPTTGACPQPSTGGGSGGGGSGGGGGGTGGGGTGGGVTPGGGTGGGVQAGAPAPPAAPATGVPAAPAGAPLARFAVVGAPRARPDGSVVLRVRAPAAGSFTVRGRGPRRAIRPARANAPGAGTITVTVRPSPAGLKLLRRSGRARVAATLVFRPVAGAPQTAKRVLTLKRTRR